MCQRSMPRRPSHFTRRTGFGRYKRLQRPALILFNHFHSENGSNVIERLYLNSMKGPLYAILLTCAMHAHVQGASTPTATAVGWKKLHLTQEFWAEGACVGDVNRDGANDILCGPFWYEGPRFDQRHPIYLADARFTVSASDGSAKVVNGFRGFLSGENGYSDNFLSFTRDINGDGWTDYIVVGHPGNETFWYQNPQDRANQPWQKHLALAKTDNESPTLVDVTNDGIPELICMSQGTLGLARPDPNNPTAPWTWYAVAHNERWQWNTHGLGYGDVNGDGRVDLLTAHNWWEQPESLSGNPLWAKHDAIFNNGGSHMFAYDIDGDGLNDVITAYEGHGYGIYWYKQMKQEDGTRTWTRFRITGAPGEESHTGIVFSQPHSMDLADINGDGLLDVISGKRFWAHGPDGDVEPNAPAVLYWFELRREGRKVRYIPHLIDDNSGVGTQVLAIDVNKDGKIDVVVGNKKGLFVHLQQ